MGLESNSVDSASVYKRGSKHASKFEFRENPRLRKPKTIFVIVTKIRTYNRFGVLVVWSVPDSDRALSINLYPRALDLVSQHQARSIIVSHSIGVCYLKCLESFCRKKRGK